MTAGASYTVDEHLAAAELCDAVVTSLRRVVPHDPAIVELERAVERARLAALDAALETVRRPTGGALRA